MELMLSIYFPMTCLKTGQAPVSQREILVLMWLWARIPSKMVKRSMRSFGEAAMPHLDIWTKAGVGRSSRRPGHRCKVFERSLFALFCRSCRLRQWAIWARSRLVAGDPMSAAGRFVPGQGITVASHSVDQLRLESMPKGADRRCS